MQLSDCTASLEETAAAIGRKPAWLKRHWRRLVSQNGGVAGGDRRRPANDDSPPPPDADPAAGLIAAQRKSLSDRYAGRP